MSHLACLYSIINASDWPSFSSKQSSNLDQLKQKMSIVFIKSPSTRLELKTKQENIANTKRQVAIKPSLTAIPPQANQTSKATDELEVEPPPQPTLNRDVKAISQSLERDLRFEQQKIEAAKPANQIAREYWQKQNYPYKDKWEELAHKIEKAGKPRGLQLETFQAADGTQITKLGNTCFKAPDPGRTYLNQAEARPVICPR
ncbi:hypothetical protein [Undibacterium baiyunense]|uniref:Uncharacterized protein n=1 Tax=Undibacterium baiyunense TaxID=2828731 RepID=A0A941DF79_9BURK|nr:hypothetical protein [Undibacterium baiyunense]MBR7747669.1 hypothetical protein [Undibacterium baiyunense]